MAVADDTADVVVIGAGVVGAACAFEAARAGLDVAVVDRGSLAGGTTSGGEGNLLVSDKEPGAELDLALLSSARWRAIGALPLRDGTVGARVELDAKGGLVVASSPATLAGLEHLAGEQAAAGIASEAVAADDLRGVEPHIAPGLAGGRFYPGDMQLQPMLAAAVLLKLARDLGARVRLHEAVVDVARSNGRVDGVVTSGGRVAAPAVVNAAGTWAGEVAALAGVSVPVMPRRGFVLVTAPLPRVVRHKVYYADYVGDVASDSAALQTSPVVEGTRSGTVLVGATRERVGFDRRPSPAALARLACGAIELFPFLRDVPLMRSYLGFRPYCPDHLPVIGPDPRLPGLFHAAGHEGAGIGLSAGTGLLVAESLTGVPTSLPLTPFRPDRFEEAAA